MDISSTGRKYRWPLLLILAAAGFWLYGIIFTPPGSPGGPVAEEGGWTLAVSEEDSRVRVERMAPEALQYLRDRSIDLSGLLAVYALPEGREWDSSLLPVDGNPELSDEGLEFTSRHSWLPGVRYHARLDRGRLLALLGRTDEVAGTIDTSFTIIRPEGNRSGQVTGVYPSADALPQNLLKFYIHFSRPMSRGDIYRHISILNEQGENIPDAFLEIPQELWDPQGMRLTILFDPGRIKRGLDQHNLLGVAFQPGRRYTLVVDSAMVDGDGFALAGEFRKSFTVTEPDRKMPDPDAWKIVAPEAGSTDPLELHFDEPMDHALARRLVSVKRMGGGGDTGNTEPAGTVEIASEERVWRFHPDEPWQAGDYELEVGRVLEDLAGNNLISVFDVDLAEEPEAPSTGGDVIKPFRIEKL